MTTDTEAFVYSFKKSYFRNYIDNRRNAINTSGNFLNMYEDSWVPYRQVNQTTGADNGVDIRAYVKEHFNGEHTKCIPETIGNELERIGDDIVDQGERLFTDGITTNTIEKEASRVVNKIKSWF